MVDKFARITQACDECTKAKRKCDGEKPCSLCSKRERTCTYTKPVRKRGVKPKSSKYVASVPPFPGPLTFPLNSIRDPSPSTALDSVKNWSRKDFLNIRLIDRDGIYYSILDLYFSFTHQHTPIYSKVWLQEHIEDVPMYILHAIYANVLVNGKHAPPDESKASPHAFFVKHTICDSLEECDPFYVAALLNLSMYDFYLKNYVSQKQHISVAIKLSQILGLHKDVDLKWRSSASGRMLGDEIGMDKQFLRSLWLLLYNWDHHDVIIFRQPMLIDTTIPSYVVDTYVSPNIGDPSNIPLNFLTHNKYFVPLMSLGKLVFKADSHISRLQIIASLDAFYASLPISYLPQSTIFLGRIINWIHEVFHFSKFWLLVPLYVDPTYQPQDRNFVPAQLKKSISLMLSSAMAFVTFCDNQINTDQAFLLFSRTMYVAALAHCLMGDSNANVLKVFIEAIRLSGYPQDFGLLWKCGVYPELAEKTLQSFLTF